MLEWSLFIDCSLAFLKAAFISFIISLIAYSIEFVGFLISWITMLRKIFVLVSYFSNFLIFLFSTSGFDPFYPLAPEVTVFPKLIPGP